MWMMSCNNGDGDDQQCYYTMPDPFSVRKLRPLIPRPLSTPIPSFNCVHGSDLFSLNPHLSHDYNGASEQNKREPVIVSSRWNPTPEQLCALEELYRCGTRTPSADQIQHITAQLRRYGKIEGKNVFYWFQNHKARERQKRRRQMEAAGGGGGQLRETESSSPERKESGANKTSHEVEQTKNWALPTNCSTLLSEESVSTQRAAPKFRRQSERNARWQMMQLSCPPLINPSTTLITATTSTVETLAPDKATSDPKLIHENHFAGGEYRCEEEEEEEPHTLQLFPLRGAVDESIAENEAEMSGAGPNTDFGPGHQFFEFLPVKN